MAQGRRRLITCLALVVGAIVLAAGNLRVAALEIFEQLGGGTTWTCRDCRGVLIYESNRLEEPLRLTAPTDDARHTHRWACQLRPDRLTPLDPFHWLAIYERGRIWPLDAAAIARLDAQAEPLIREYGSGLKGSTPRDGPPPP